MEIKAILEKPYTNNDRFNFIVGYNHNMGFEIKETDTELQAWGFSEEEIQQKEREYINNLSMTRGDVFEALILAKGVTKNQIRATIEDYEGLDDITRALYLNRFDEALNFYRGYPIFDLIGQTLGLSSEQLDNFFITKDWKELTY